MILIAIIAGICFGMLTFHYWNRLFGQDSTLEQASFTPWLWGGLLVPSFVWVLLNSGLMAQLPPLIPEISAAKAGGRKWVPMIFDRTLPGLLTISSYWAAVTFAHFTVLIGLHAEPRREFGVIAAMLGLLALPFVWITCAEGGLEWAGIAAMLWLLPMTHCTVALACRPKPVPMYARAIARLKLGKYRDAEQEVIQQLEKAEDDFDGWMILAELYARQFGDLPEADRTVRGLCDQPNLSALQISMALNRLADWQLNLGEDPIAARRALEEIIARLPGSHSARMARQRLEQLPASRKEWLEQKQPRKLRLPDLTGNLDDPQPAATLSRPEALDLVQEYVDRLKRDPNEVAPREKLALLFAEHLGKADLGIEQLELLLNMPGQPEEKLAEWISRTAAWHLRFRQDRVAGRRALDRVVRDYPQTAQAFAAQRWLNLLEMEDRMQRGRAGSEGPQAITGPRN